MFLFESTSLPCKVVKYLWRVITCAEEQGIQDGTFAATVGADEDDKRREVVQFAVLNAAKIADFE